MAAAPAANQRHRAHDVVRPESHVDLGDDPPAALPATILIIVERPADQVAQRPLSATVFG